MGPRRQEFTPMAENCGLSQEHEQREITNGATGTTGRGGRKRRRKRRRKRVRRRKRSGM